MQLLSTVPSLEDYYRDLELLLNSKDTHIYIDTSFLMWLTKLGGSARNEFFAWVNEIGQDRVHVPLWASHEYHQHFIDSTISKDTKEFVSKLNQASKNFYSALLPAIVEANAPPRWSSDKIKTDTRQAVLDLMRFGSLIESWSSQTWDERSSAIIEFINQRCLKSGSTFKYLNTIGQTTDNRFSGRIPPGFQDRLKKDTTDEGGNRAGDLMFWKEILDHARGANCLFRHGVKSVIVLTNDMKNDWVTGGESVKQDGSNEVLRGVLREGTQIPIIHPMLEHEAQTYAKVRHVMLMNSFALGMHFLATQKAPTFVEITISIKLPKYDHKELILKKVENQSKNASNYVPASATAFNKKVADENTANSSAEIQEQLMAPPQLLRYASSDPAKNAASVSAIIDDMLSISGVASPIVDWFTGEPLASAEPERLIWIGRLLASRAIQNVTNANSRVIDLLHILNDFEASKASQLYTGILFGIYFDDNNQQRATAKPEFIQIVFKYQMDGFALPGMNALYNAFGSDKRPAYLPTSECPQIEAEAQTKTHGKTVSLSALLIGGVNFLTPVAEDDAHTLCKLLKINKSALNKETVTAHDLILTAAQVIGFPSDQIRVKNELNRQIKIAVTDGLDITKSGDASDD